VDRLRFTAFLLASAMEGDSMKHSVLEQALQAIEASDKRIVKLLSLRRQLATQLAQAMPGQEVMPSLDERVAAVVSRLAPGNPGPLNHQRLASLFEAVIRLTEPLFSTLAARNGAAKKG
jgi:chorismate mutase